MAIFLPLLAAGALGVAGGFGASALLGGASSKKEEKAMESKTITYAPQTTTSEVYSPTSTYAYSPQVSYAPQVIISSPGATQESKKEFSSRIDQEATSTPTISQTPQQTIPITYTQPSQDVRVGSDMTTLLLIAGAGVATIMLLKD